MAAVTVATMRRERAILGEALDFFATLQDPKKSTLEQWRAFNSLLGPSDLACIVALGEMRNR